MCMNRNGMLGRPVVVNDGQEAVDLIVGGGSHFDLVLCDVQMPGTSIPFLQPLPASIFLPSLGFDLDAPSPASLFALSCHAC